MNSLFSTSSGRVFLFVLFCVRVVLGEGKAERTGMQDRSETNLLVLVCSRKHQCKNFANKVNKLEEWLLAPPVYSLRGTHAYGELLFAEPSRAEHTRNGYTGL
jgi:hypothetical protein